MFPRKGQRHMLFPAGTHNRSGPYLSIRAASVVCEQRGKRESREEVGLSFLPDILIIHVNPLPMVNGL